jgi:hypothetical protein
MHGELGDSDDEDGADDVDGFDIQGRRTPLVTVTVKIPRTTMAAIYRMMKAFMLIVNRMMSRKWMKSWRIRQGW